MKRLENKVAIITGGAGLIGFTTALGIAREGARVMLVDLDENQLREKVAEAKEEGMTMEYVVADVTQAVQVQNYVDETIGRYGRIDLFFNNAGIDGEVNLTENYSEDSFDKVMAVNVKGVFLGMKYVIPKIQDGGSIVITSSIAGLIGEPGMVAYHASKHAVVGIMRTTAKEVAKRQIRVNSVHPGFVDSPMMRHIEKGINPEDSTIAQGKLQRRVPLGRYAKAADVSKMVAFLFSDDAAYSTGSTFVTDGGVVGR